MASSQQGGFTRFSGCPVAQNAISLTAGPTGPVLLQDVELLEKLMHFDREKVPPRNVHALGAGCYGTFSASNDISQYSKAAVFKRGTTTDVMVRFSGVFNEVGDADCSRDLRGFAVKFYSTEGNYDMLCVNTPCFNVRDGKTGPDAIHAFKRDPRTGEWNPEQTWDFINNHPESLHNTLMFYSDRCTPFSYRYLDYWPCNTYSMINSNNKRVYVRFHWLSQQGCCGLTGPDAKLLAGEDPNFLSKDLRDAIANNQLPRWKLAFQVMSEEQAQTCLEAFDPTKVWKHSEYPLVDIGTLELNRLPMDYHSEVEQVAFSPSNVVPGISFSPDKLLQSRLFIYPDTQNHRLGPNYQMIPVNRPLKTQFKNMGYVGGAHNTETGSKFPHYFPSSLGGQSENPIAGEPPIHTDGDASWYQPPALGMPDDFYGQAKSFYLKAIDDKQRMAIADNIAESLSKVREEVLQKAMFHLDHIDSGLAQNIKVMIARRRDGSRKPSEAEALRQSLKAQLTSAKVTYSA